MLKFETLSLAAKSFAVHGGIEYMLWLTNSEWRKLRHLEQRIDDTHLEIFIQLVELAHA